MALTFDKLRQGVDLIKAMKVAGAVGTMIKKRVAAGDGKVVKIDVQIEFESGKRISFDARDIIEEFLPLTETEGQDGERGEKDL